LDCRQRTVAVECYYGGWGGEEEEEEEGWRRRAAAAAAACALGGGSLNSIMRGQNVPGKENQKTVRK
jgi:hypothetical protein